jgi:hypothetical protein
LRSINIKKHEAPTAKASRENSWKTPLEFEFSISLPLAAGAWKYPGRK